MRATKQHHNPRARLGRLEEYQMKTFEKLTLLSSHDLNNHVFSIIANEEANEVMDEDESQALRLLRVARQLRLTEYALVHDGVPAPSLDKLRALANLQDDTEDEFKAFHAIRDEIGRMAAA
jgi:hypothetical protein